KRMVMSFDWSRQFNTCDPEYYRWTQWLFIRLFEKGLAYRKLAPANWCPKDQTVLANEQVVRGACERCGTPVVRKDLVQWFFRITDYAQRLLDDMEDLEAWPDRVLTMQRNWIGRSEGAQVQFTIEETGDQVEVFTTRPDTLWGVTFFEFATEHRLPIRVVIQPEGQTLHGDRMGEAYEGEGVMVNSGPFDDRRSPESIPAVTAWLDEQGRGGPAISYRLRDWLISRQRYWGAPISIIHCDEDG